MPQRIGVLVVLLVVSASAAGQTWQSAIVRYDSTGRLTYVRDSLGNRIPDFSHAGFGGGGVPLPVVPQVRTLAPIPGDNTAHLQAAIDSVGALPPDGDGIRGALVLAPGVYPVYGTVRLRHSGAVLRGAGDGADSLTNTILAGRGNTPHQRTILIAGGGSQTAWRDSVAGTRTNVLSDTVLVGDRRFRIQNPAPFAVGDNIIFYHPCTAEWLAAIGYGGTHFGEPGSDSGDVGWTVNSQPIVYNRYITGISGDTITIDAPVFNTLVRPLAQSYVYKYARQGLRTKIGIENLRIDIETAGGTDENHAWHAVELWQIEDAWMKRCTMLHFGQSGVMTHTASRITIDSCSALDPVSLITGERRYNFNMYTASQQVLVSRCTTSKGRHDYVSNGMSWVSGCVFLDCTSIDTYAMSEGHRRWTTGLLFDNITFVSANDDPVLGLYNRGHYGTGHGWAVAHSVAWNCNAAGGTVLVQRPPTAQNYIIGAQGTVTGQTPPAPFVEPQGYIEGTNMSGLHPRSLYLAQLADRLNAPPAQHTISTLAGPNGTITPGGAVVVARGGNQTFSITPAAFHEVDSLLVDGLPVDSTTSYTFVNVVADHTLRAVFRPSAQSTITVGLSAGWNLLSLPVSGPAGGDSLRGSFPSALYPFAFTFTPAGYLQSPVLETGRGYWAKFPGVLLQPVTGTAVRAETVAVLPGWNTVGCISCAVDTGAIVAVPAGLRSSAWYRYGTGYAPVEELLPGKGYWVKATTAGSFILACPERGPSRRTPAPAKRDSR